MKTLRGIQTVAAPSPDPPPEPTKWSPNEREKASLARLDKRKAEAAPLPKVTVEKLEKDGVLKMGVEHDSADLVTAAALQMSALGLTYLAEDETFLRAATNICMRNGAIDAAELNGVLALVAGMKPDNTIEALLALQMAALHQTAMRLAASLRQADELEALQWRSKTFNNLTRTFATHAETLQRLRTKPGQQKVTVEHRHYYLAPGAIAEGGQAVLGDVSGGGGKNQIEDQSDERDGMLLSERAAMLGALETNGHAMQGAGPEWKEGVPVPRRPSRSADRAS